ncbi:pumilio homolog 24-like [Chenopodium quinoa]|uniref:pumilio homolog 24-like n=1 Tax=Chenopodium quinoa TaxID=63459 RepID=UPI000B770230|nr:pumilio homolog 24-like [Chenopodium quinoa]
MAPKDKSEITKKRKRDSGSKIEATYLSKIEKKPKKLTSKPISAKPFKKKVEIPVKDGPLSKKELRQIAKEKTEARKKKRKRHFTLEQELALLWEKMRRRNISKEERSKFVSEALQKMKGKIPEIAGSHISSRVLQTCVKHCSDAERDVVYEELKPHLLTLASSTYAVHLVTKMFDNASKSQLPRLISLLHGHVASLLRHSVGSIVVEHAYEMGNAAQKRELLMELYSTELQLFKDLSNIKENKIVDIISKIGLKKLSVLRHMTCVIQPILEKGIVDHSIIHKALIEYLSIADKLSAEDVIKQLSGSLLVRMIHTKDGSRIGMLCVKHGSAKERKKLIKGMKGHVGKIAHDQCGSLVLASVLSTVDDTKLVTKVIIRELQPILSELVLDKSGRRPVLQLLHPNCLRYLSLDDLASLNASIPSLCPKAENEANHNKDKLVESSDNDEEDKEVVHVNNLLASEADESMEPEEDTHLAEGGKKDPFVRRQELLVRSGLAESLVDVCIESAEELLKSNFGKDVLYEVATGGVDGILRPTLDEKLTSLYEKVATLAAQPKSDESEHVLENFHSSRTIRRLVLDCPAFASILWKTTLEGNSKLWAVGHSAKVVAAFVESSDLEVQKMASKVLQPLINSGVLKISETKPAEK